MAGFEGPIYLALGTSRLLRRAVRAIHLAAAALVGCSVSGPAYAWFALAVIALHACYAEWCLARERGDDVIALLLTGDDGWRLGLRDGRAVDATLLRAPLICVGLIAVSLRLESGAVHHLALFSDNVAADPLRRLRVRLRYPRGGVDGGGLNA